MREKINLLKWLTELPIQKRVTAYSIIIIFSLASLIYGLTCYIKSDIDRDREECQNNNIRLNNKLIDSENKREKCQERLLFITEDYAKKLERLEVKTEMLEKKLNENN